MPDISEETLIPAPLGVVWPLLSDPAEVAACIPGAQLAPSTGDGLWRGAIKVKFGPTTAAFRGEAKLDYDHDAHRCRIEGRGIDQRGASRALANGEVLAAAEGDATRLTVNGSFTVTGPLETFANAGGVTDNMLSVPTIIGHYYTTRLRNLGYQSTRAVVMKTTLLPSGILSVSQSPSANPASGTQVSL
ncbi:MAG: hypothetical protein EBU14_03315, partial [Acetobacteraceae bacterium]|nr:hypothetical protein [Acetobacteraceae bacterium]